MLSESQVPCFQHSTLSTSGTCQHWSTMHVMINTSCWHSSHCLLSSVATTGVLLSISDVNPFFFLTLLLKYPNNKIFLIWIARVWAQMYTPLLVWFIRCVESSAWQDSHKACIHQIDSFLDSLTPLVKSTLSFTTSNSDSTYPQCNLHNHLSQFPKFPNSSIICAVPGKLDMKHLLTTVPQELPIHERRSWGAQCCIGEAQPLSQGSRAWLRLQKHWAEPWALPSLL